MATCPVQWRTVRKGGDPKTDQEGTTRTPGLHPEETEALTARRDTLKPAWSASTHCEGKGPENPGVVAPLPDAGCRGNRRCDTFGLSGGMMRGAGHETQRRLNFGAVSLSQNLYKSYCYLYEQSHSEDMFLSVPIYSYQSVCVVRCD